MAVGLAMLALAMHLDARGLELIQVAPYAATGAAVCINATVAAATGRFLKYHLILMIGASFDMAVAVHVGNGREAAAMLPVVFTLGWWSYATLHRWDVHCSSSFPTVHYS